MKKGQRKNREKQTYQQACFIMPLTLPHVSTALGAHTVRLNAIIDYRWPTDSTDTTEVRSYTAPTYRGDANLRCCSGQTGRNFLKV